VTKNIEFATESGINIVYLLMGPMECICVNLVNPIQFFQFLDGRCHGNQFCSKIVAKLPMPPALMTLSFRNGTGYRSLNVRINSTIIDASISCENFVKFGPEIRSSNSRVDRAYL